MYINNSKLRKLLLLILEGYIFTFNIRTYYSVSANKMIDVPYINQNSIVYGCEAVSSTMLLRHHGYNILEKEFTDNYLIRKDWKVGAGGKVYGPDPYSAYPGNPYISRGINCGYGSYAPSTAKSIERVLNASKHKAIFHIGMDLGEVINRYINNDVPVLIWATIGMIESKPGDSWIINYIDENARYKIGDLFRWKRNEHCLVLVGYDDEKYYFNDPYKNQGRVGYAKNLVEKRYKELGSQCVTILKT